MLVLSRKRNDSVVIGDEVRVTVERISLGDSSDGVAGAAVRIGFQSPRHVPIFRSELCRQASSGHFSPRPKRRVEGRIVPIPDAEVRLRIEVPPKIPVACNGTQLSASTRPTERAGDEPRGTVHYVTCRKEDRITICHNITIAMLNVQRFIPDRLNRQAN